MTGPDRVAVITGANRGTGRAIAEELHRSGWLVWGLSREPVAGAHYRQVACDLTERGALPGAIRLIDEECGRIDAVIANAVDRGLGPAGTLPEIQWQRAIDVNLNSVLSLVQATLPLLRGSQGAIVLMGSHAGSRFFEGGLAYCASKAALKAMAEVLLLEERPNGVRTTLLSPGAIANEDGDKSAYKISTCSIAVLVRTVLDLPRDLDIGELEVRPALLPTPLIYGLDRLQAV